MRDRDDRRLIFVCSVLWLAVHVGAYLGQPALIPPLLVLDIGLAGPIGLWWLSGLLFRPAQPPHHQPGLLDVIEETPPPRPATGMTTTDMHAYIEHAYQGITAPRQLAYKAVWHRIHDGRADPTVWRTVNAALNAYEAAAKALAESGKKPDEDKKDLIMQSVDVST